MKLIDADKLILYLNDYALQESPFMKDDDTRKYDAIQECMKAAEEQPTAYDVEKVARELKELKMRYFLTISNTGDADKDCAYLNTANAIDRAIEIVNRGGIDEE